MLSEDFAFVCLFRKESPTRVGRIPHMEKFLGHIRPAPFASCSSGNPRSRSVWHLKQAKSHCLENKETQASGSLRFAWRCGYQGGLCSSSGAGATTKKPKSDQANRLAKLYRSSHSSTGRNNALCLPKLSHDVTHRQLRNCMHSNQRALGCICRAPNRRLL